MCFFSAAAKDSIPFFVVLKAQGQSFRPLQHSFFSSSCCQGVMGRYEAEVSASPPSLAEDTKLASWVPPAAKDVLQESQEAPSGLEEKLRAQEERV